MVEGYTGRPGAGKTASMVAAAYREKQKGRAVWSNIPLIDTRPQVQSHWLFGKKSSGPQGHRRFGQSWADGRVANVAEVVRLDNCRILLDEVHMWMPATDWASIPFEVRSFLAQQRKNGLDISWTAQASARVFNVVRELTAVCWACARYGPLSILKGTDPETKEDMGKRFLYCPQVFGLYDTLFIVGNAAGEGGGRGVSTRYGEHAVPAQLEGCCVRYEFGGHVYYEPASLSHLLAGCNLYRPVKGQGMTEVDPAMLATLLPSVVTAGDGTPLAPMALPDDGRTVALTPAPARPTSRRRQRAAA